MPNTTTLASPAATATAEEIAEQIAERREDILDVLRTAGTVPAQAVKAVAIVGRALIVVGEDLIRVRAFFEALLGGLVARVFVGVKFLRELAIGLLQVGLIRALFDPEYFVEITHRRRFSRLWVMRLRAPVKVSCRAVTRPADLAAGAPDERDAERRATRLFEAAAQTGLDLGTLDGDALQIARLAVQRAPYLATLLTRDPNRLMRPAAVAEAYWQLYQQPRDAWTFEHEIRPFGEKW